MFLYEMHCHTSQGSRCASMSGAEVAEIYAGRGYQGIVITDHFYKGNTAVDRQLPWETWVDLFCEGYRDAKKTGDALGLQVFLGWEYCYRGTEILTYGLDEKWLLEHPELREISLEEYCALVRSAGGLAIHAHPFRRRDYIKMIRLVPELTDGVECVNKANSPREDFLADQYADNYGLLKIGGSDFHSIKQADNLGGIALPTIARDTKAIFEAVKAGESLIL